MKQENLFEPDCIRTYTGLYMNVFEPTPEMIDIRDIAHSLSYLCRFGGHMPIFYSVAQHSVACANKAQMENPRDTKFILTALMHDAAEAYLQDIPRPIKNKLNGYKQLENNLLRAIAIKYDFIYPLPASVINIDDEMLHREWEHIVLDKYKDCGSWFKPQEEFEKDFITIFNLLIK